jgi:hypothetical protein
MLEFSNNRRHKMVKDKEKVKENDKCSCFGCKHGWKHKSKGAAGGCGFYFLGFLGAVIFFIENTSGFWLTIWAILKAIVWPVFVVHHLLGL